MRKVLARICATIILFCLLLSLSTSVAHASTSEEKEPILSADVLFDLVNTYRQKLNLPAFIKDESLCSITTSRAPEVYNEIFVQGPMHKGFYSKNLPYFATENIIYMRNEESALNWWLNSPIHKNAVLGKYTYSCIACSGQSCSEIFTNFEPKVTQESFVSITKQ